jgi:hypothetical protein
MCVQAHGTRRGDNELVAGLALPPCRSEGCIVAAVSSFLGSKHYPEHSAWLLYRFDCIRAGAQAGNDSPASLAIRLTGQPVENIRRYQRQPDVARSWHTQRERRHDYAAPFLRRQYTAMTGHVVDIHLIHH